MRCMSRRRRSGDTTRDTLYFSPITVTVTGHIVSQARAVITAVHTCNLERLLFCNSYVKQSNGQSRDWKRVYKFGDISKLIKGNTFLLNPSTAQRSLYVPHSGHYVYGTAVTMCTAHRSLCVPHSGHYVYRTAVTMCTAQWSLYVPHNGHYMYHTAVTMCTAQWSLRVPHSVHCVYRAVVIICTAQRSVYVPPV
jgi:hypothetical protein